MFLGPSGTDEVTPVVVNDVSLSEPPAQETNAVADKADKQSMQKHGLFFFFFKGNMLIRSLSVLPAGFHSISMFFFTGAALNNSRTVSCFMLLYDVTIDVYLYSV